MTHPGPPGAGVTPGVILSGVTWADYEEMLRIIGERRIFVNYDRGVMEVMAPSYIHEDIRDCLRLMVDILCEELGIPMKAGGTTTHRREDLEKGVEPDECYWLRAKAAAMVGRIQLNLTVDPTPTLVIEVNYTSSSVNRMAIYAALRVEEVWRFDERLIFLALREDGVPEYEPTDPSRQFPWLTLAEANRQLDAFRSMGRLEWMRAFRRQVRDQWAPPPQERADGPEPLQGE
jgi:Uma2 family endonuclease